jgi:hypothetical protein
VVVAGHHGDAAGLFDGVDDGPLVRGHDDRAEAGLYGASPDMHDHGLAQEVGEGLSGEPR